MMHKVEKNPIHWTAPIRWFIAIIATGTTLVAPYSLVLSKTVWAPDSPNTLVALGNRVWFDTNNDGAVSVGEDGIGQVRLNLYQDSNASGVYDAGDTYISFQTTSNGGFYLFPELEQTTAPVKRYIVVVDGSNFCQGAALFSLTSSTGNVGGDSDLNNQDHGIDPATPGCNTPVGGGASTILFGKEPINDGDADANTNLTIDFGFYKPVTATQTPTSTSTSTPTATLTATATPQPTATASPTTTPLPKSTATATATQMPPTATATPVIPSPTPTSTQVKPTSTSTALPPTPTRLIPSLTPPPTSAISSPTPVPPTATPVPSLLAGLGNYVWNDSNRDGFQSPVELGIAGITVTLMSGSTPISTTRTGISGIYVFRQLPAGSYSVCFTLPEGYTFTVPGSDPASDTDSNANRDTGCTATVTLIAGDYDPSIDAGVHAIPTAIQLSLFEAQVDMQAGHSVVRLRWQTSLENDTFGFQILRGTSGNLAEAVVLNQTLIAAQGRNSGATYEWIDATADPKQPYFYWLRETELSGNMLHYGPTTFAPTTHTAAIAATPVAVAEAVVVPAGALAGGVKTTVNSDIGPQNETVQPIATISAGSSAAAVVVKGSPVIQATVQTAQSQSEPVASGSSVVRVPVATNSTKIEIVAGLAQADASTAMPLQSIQTGENPAYATDRVVHGQPAVADRAANGMRAAVQPAQSASIQSRPMLTLAPAHATETNVMIGDAEVHWQQETAQLTWALIVGVSLFALGGIFAALAVMRRRAP